MAQDNSFETLLVEKEEGIAVVTLNRPKALNAMCHQMIVDLMAAIACARRGRRDQGGHPDRFRTRLLRRARSGRTAPTDGPAAYRRDP